MSVAKLTIAQKDALVQQWLDSKTTLERAKEMEMQLRQQVKAVFVPEAPEKGTINHELGNGYKLKFEFKQTVSLDQSKVDATIAKLERQGDEGKFIVDRLFKFKADLSITEYNQLSDKMRKIVDEIVTKRPATPVITFVEPKNK